MKAKIFGLLALIILLIGATGCINQNSEPAKVVEAATDARFTAYADSSELIGKEPVILFFHADWCGSCVGLEKDINENIDDLPEDVRILKVDFDKETELKKKYGVLMQSMFVVLDKNGNVVEKLVAPSFDKLKDTIATSL